ncbi:hypothetical protein CI105_08970 [Candidatus Izimaplasma bacterium ZiA1]|uniref:phosphotransferase n=1 Tax=Candidatus Izimoplasma sp. ZiA1 TaxID=2024899 RepID=UPI000BAA66DD|nr:hypothetical protein CI105_08970 [Candidatus Izimaplasma bacterium ZiA1]
MKELIKSLKMCDYLVTKITIGRSDSDVYRLVKDKDIMYLKIGGELVNNLTQVLTYLETSKINVPKIIKKGTYKNRFYVLMSECKGTMAHELEPLLAIKILARGLREIHDTKIDESLPLKDCVYYKNLITSKLIEELSNEDKEFIYSLESLDLQNDLVFTHGDYSLPNVLYDNDCISFIDLDYAGVSFRYLDILDCLWSINYNFNDKLYEDMFLKAYGIDELDINKVKSLKRIQRILKIKGYQ